MRSVGHSQSSWAIGCHSASCWKPSTLRTASRHWEQRGVLQQAWYTIFGQESCRTKVSRILRIFVPNFAPNFAPNFPRIFRGLLVLRFVGDGDQKKIHQNSPPFFNAKFPGKHEKLIFTEFFWRAGKVILSALTRSWWIRLGQKSQKFPSSTVKNVPNRHPPKRWVLFMFWHFVFFCFFVFFPPDSSYFSLFLDILKPKMAHQRGL